MKKIYLASATLIALSVFNLHFSILHAQQEDAYNESVIVKGSYRPTIEQGQKLNFPAEITDTLGRIDHTFRYSITPVRLSSAYEPSRIKAARIIGEPATKLYNNYIRLGFGNYWSPLADLYWNSTRDHKKTYGVRLNHHSSWDKLLDYSPNHFGNTGITLFGKYILGEKLQLSSDISYEHDHNLYYGFTDTTLFYTLPGYTRDSITTKDYRASYNIATWNIGVKNMQLDPNKLGYSANVHLSDLWALYGQNEFNLNVSGDIHYGFEMMREYKGVAYLHAEMDGYKHSFSPDVMPLGYLPATLDSATGYRNIVKVNPYADFIFNGLQFHSGLTVGWDSFTNDNATTFRFFPDFIVSKKLMHDNLAVSLGATGGIEANNWNTIRLVNPYVGPNAEQRATRHYDFAAHARWTLSRKLEASADISYSVLLDDLTFSLDTNYSLRNVYRTHYFDNNRFTVGGLLTFVNDEMITLRAGAHYYAYNITSDDSLLLYRPKWDAMVAADVNYHDKWFFHLSSQLIGQMTADNNEVLPMRYGVAAAVEYRHNRALSFFLKMDNLAFQRYYYWNNYPSQRGLFILGLTYTIPHK
ncbi:MAG: hypothetical protein J6W88_03580 [Bacteroidales bacterium]|nr:hypothetical protein [Bacteroidales bacterium]